MVGHCLQRFSTWSPSHLRGNFLPWTQDLFQPWPHGYIEHTSTLGSFWVSVTFNTFHEFIPLPALPSWSLNCEFPLRSQTKLNCWENRLFNLITAIMSSQHLKFLPSSSWHLGHGVGRSSRALTGQKLTTYSCEVVRTLFASTIGLPRSRLLRPVSKSSL